MKALKISTSIVLAVVALVFGVYAVSQSTQKAHAVGAQATTIGVATTTSSVAVTTSTRVLATTTNALGDGTSYTRIYASICNPSAVPVALNLDGDKLANLSTGHATTVIAAAAGYNVCYEITDRNQYSGSITASSTTQASVKVLVKDYVQ